MAKLLDQILVIDLESTCWEGDPPPGQISEIIEIGVATVDVATLQRGQKRSILVKPTRSEISAFCTKLTTLKPDDFKFAGTFEAAVKLLKKEYQSQDRLWASWGDYDRRQFERLCKEFGVGYPFGISHLNVKSLFAISHGLDHEVGLDTAYERIGQKMEGTHHRGHDDAWNIAAILCGLLKATRPIPAGTLAYESHIPVLPYASMESRQFVTIAMFPDEVAAQLAALKLEAENVPVQVRVQPYGIGERSGSLLVQLADAPRSRAILETTPAKAFLLAEGEDPESPESPE